MNKEQFVKALQKLFNKRVPDSSQRVVAYVDDTIDEQKALEVTEKYLKHATEGRVCRKWPES